jgi:16S rRNA G966 N2-methylase RsmD
MSRAFKAVRAKAGPALINSAFWLAHNLRRREIRKRYNKALVFSHTRIADRRLEKLFFVPTLKSQLIDPAPERGIHYDGPVPASVFNWAMAPLPQDLRQFAFIDIRAGRGRTSLLAAKRNFNRIIAYEYDDQVFDDLSMNIAQFPRSLMACRNIDCYRGDIDGIRMPDQPCVVYFSGAWREQVIPGVMNYVRQTYRQSPRRIYVVLENVDDKSALASDDIFQRVEPALADRLKLRLLSPMDFRVYRTIA